MSIRSPLSAIVVLCATAIAFLLPSAAAADSYSASFNAGEVVASANANFTEATLERIVYTGDDCGSAAGEVGCTWEVKLSLSAGDCADEDSQPQTVWASGPQNENGTVTATGIPISLEGCRGQTLSISYRFEPSYEENAPGGGRGPWRLIGEEEQWLLFTFGYHPVEEAEGIQTANPPVSHEYPPFQLNFTPRRREVAIASDCRSVELDSVRYALSFHRLGCGRAAALLRAKFLRGTPGGYLCRSTGSTGTRCWRRGRPDKYVEWRIPPRSKPAA